MVVYENRMKIRANLFPTAFLGAVLQFTAALAQPVHGIAMHGEPSLPPGYQNFTYVDPDAPKGGEITYGVVGSFDSVNPFILKSMRNVARGSWDHKYGRLVFESLMMRSRDEPFTMYGLLAKKAEWPDDRKWIEFTLDERARWSDGMPVTVDDVIFTYELLTEKGRPPYNSRMKKISGIEQTAPNKVRFNFNEKADREFPMIIALSPILPKHAINPDTFDQSSLKPMIGSGPYLMDEIKPGSSISYKRDPGYWAKDLPSRRGFANQDKVRVEYFRNRNSLLEAFKKGIVDVIEEGDPAAWRRQYDFPAVANGDVIQDTITTRTPAPMLGFVFNTRRDVFQNAKLRKALYSAFDFEWVNRNLFYNVYSRTVSFWHGSELSSHGVPASSNERALLADQIGKMNPKILDGSYAPLVTNGLGRDRRVYREIMKLLADAGFQFKNGKLVDADGNQLGFEILVKNASEEKIALAFQRNLAKFAIEAKTTRVDDTQYQRRLQDFDYDMVIQTFSASLSPGIEQIGRWGSQSRDLQGSYNFAGVADPALDGLIQQMLNARERDAFIAAVRAFDRMLISGHYVIPLYHTNEKWIARWKHVKRPDKSVLYGYRFETWWDGRAGQETQ